jgi:polygalacturonase
MVWAWSAWAQTAPVINVRDYGAKGDGVSLDTAAIQRAIEDCYKAGGGQVVFPPGRYLAGTIHLRDNLNLILAPGSRLVGSTNLSEYVSPAVPDFMPEAKWGKWHRALVLGQNCTNLTISGGGTVDGSKVFDPTGEERMRGPHTVLFVNCRNFDIRDITILDSANYAIFFQVSDDIRIHNVRFVGGWDGIHFRGAPQHWCRNVSITGCQFYTGDDGIAGRYWDNTVIADCIINSSCNGIRLIGPATRLIVTDCLFMARASNRTASSRTNMLSGIILQPGAWDATQGLLDEVLISRNTMKNVASPVTLWSKTGNTVGRVTISNLDAEGVCVRRSRRKAGARRRLRTSFCGVFPLNSSAVERQNRRDKRCGLASMPVGSGLGCLRAQREEPHHSRCPTQSRPGRPPPSPRGDTVDHLRVEGFRHTIVQQAAAHAWLTNVVQVTTATVMWSCQGGSQ